MNQILYGYDANGNMTVMPGLKCKYDAWNRLTQVTDSNDNLIAEYGYNGLNHRIKKTVGGVITKSFFSKNWQELESIKETGTSVPAETTTYVWGLRYIDDLVLREKGEERLYSLADPNWNAVAIVNASGTVIERYTYDAFRKRTVMSGVFVERTASEYDWNRTFTGQVFDAETGLMLYRNRYYSTSLGRFVSRDPIGYRAEDSSLYRYVKNSVPYFVDSYGLACDSVSTSIAEAIAKGNIAHLKLLLASGGLSAQQIQDILAAIAALELAERIARCRQPNCKPCTPPASTESYRVDTVPPAIPHRPYKGTHTHHYRMNQGPAPLCICSRNEISVTEGTSPRPGEVPNTFDIGGGPI